MSGLADFESQAEIVQPQLMLNVIFGMQVQYFTGRCVYWPLSNHFNHPAITPPNFHKAFPCRAATDRAEKSVDYVLLIQWSQFRAEK